jgi:hypothetical protein
VTYNFDADAWYDRERALLEARRQRGELTETALAAALEDLERRYDELIARLDKPFEVR